MHVTRYSPNDPDRLSGLNLPTPILTANYAVEDGGDLLEYSRMLWRNKWRFAAITVVCTLIAVLISMPQPPVYQATASMELQGINENFLNLRSLNPTDPVIGAMAFETYIQTQVEIIRDFSLVHKVVKHLRLDEHPQFSREEPSVLNRLLGKNNTASPLDVALQRAMYGLKVRPSAQTRIVRVSMDSTDPEIAAQIANALVDLYIQENLESRWKSSEKTGEWLKGQIAVLKDNLKTSEAELQTYARNSGLLYTAEKNSVAEERLRQIQDELSKAQAERMAKQSHYELTMAAKPESLPQALQNAVAREHQTKLVDLRREFAEQSTLLTPTHYKVRRIQEQITELERALERELANTVRTIQNEYTAAATREKLLTDEYNSQVQVIRQQAPEAAQYSMLKREVDSARNFHETIAQQLQEARIASAIRASNVRVIGRASAPRHPYKPNHALNAAIGAFAGMFLSFGFIFVREKTNRTYAEPGDLTMHLRVPELGAIPTAARVGVRGRPGASLLGIKEHEPELTKWTQSGIMAESFRAVLASMTTCLPESSHPRVLLITSPGPIEGKTMVAGSLAVELARSGRRVLVIDADVRRPKLSRLFHASSEAGLKEMLTSADAITPDAVRRYVHPTSVPGLNLMPAGRADTNDPQFIDTSRFAFAMLTLRSQYDFVFFDSPPTLPVADARFLSRLVDAVVLVVRANQTSRDATFAAVSRLYADNLPLLGIVLNDWNPRASSSYKAYCDYYEQHSHSSKESERDGLRAPIRLGARS